MTAGDNVRSDPMPEVHGGEARFLTDEDYIGSGRPVGIVPAEVGDEPQMMPTPPYDPNVEIDQGMFQGFLAIQQTSQRIRAKIEADQTLVLDGEPRPHHQRWHQAEDGTWFSDPTGPLTVVVERQSPADLPFIHVLGRMQEMNPGVARWLSLRLAEATAIAETAVIP